VIKQRFVLDESKRLFLDLTARTKWTHVQLNVGTTSLGPPLSRADLREGQSYTLPDESELLIQLDMPVFLPTLRIERDGVVVPGSEASAEFLTERAGRWLIGVGVLTILVAYTGPMMAIRNALSLVGLFWVATGFFARRGSFPALVLGSGLYFLGALQGITSANMTTVFLQVVILTPMFRALYAHYLDRNAAARPLRRDHVPLAVVKSVIRAPTDFAETIAPSSRPRIAGGDAPPATSVAASLPVVAAPAGGMTERSDQKVGAYILTGTLGSGGMATVYKARQTSIGRDVALKVITGNHQADPEFFERFRREAETTARLSHPNILKIFDFGEDAGRPFLAMEYMSGGTLRSRIGTTALPVAQVLKWAEQVGPAIQSAHTQGVVHRDIKPENVLLDQAGNAFLADFGLARLSDAKSNLTQIGTQMGSPSYMSPEQWEGADVTEAADLYSFGAMLFELLSGSPPFRAATLPALMTQHVKAPVPSIRALRPSLPVSMDAYFSKALAKAPDQRFADGAAMVDGLRLGLRGATVAQPAGPAAQASRPAALPARPVTQTIRPVTQTVRPVTQVARPVAPPSSAARPVRAAAPSKSWLDLIRSPVGVAVAIVLALAGFGAWRQRSASARPAGEDGEGVAARPAVKRPAPAVVATPVPASKLVGDLHPLPYRLVDAAFSRALNKVVVIADGTAAVMIVDPETGETSRIELPGFPRSVTTSPEGLAALVTSESAVWLVNLASRTVDHTVNVSVKGSTALMGSWAYILPEKDQWENLRSINLLSGEIKTGTQQVYAGGLMKAHQSGRRLYMVDRHLSPEDIYRIDATLGPALAIKDSRFHGDHPICEDLWFSEKGDFAFTGCGNAFSLSEDPAADMDFAGVIPNLQSQKISAFTHSEVAGRLLLVADRTVKTPGGDDSRDILMTYEFPGFRFVARDVLPRLGTPENPAIAFGRFVFASRDGRRMYVVLETPPASSKVSSAILAAAIK